MPRSIVPLARVAAWSACALATMFGGGARSAAAPAPLDYASGGLPDYAPSGVPDFSACRPEWSRRAAEPNQPGQWTFAAPTALADVLWWLDSRAEPGSAPPPAVRDNHALVTAYPAFGPPRDDHDIENIGPLIEDLAVRLNTDNRGRPGTVRGTEWASFVHGAEDYVASRRIKPGYSVASTVRPSGAWLRAQAARGAGVVVLIGVWEQSGAEWRRIGGHYAALAGVDDQGAAIALADPVYDQSVWPDNGGRMVPADGAVHSCRNAPHGHDDAGVISHDRYELFPPPGLAEGEWALAGYFRPETFGDGAAFAGQNPAEFLAAASGAWQRGVLIGALDAALAVQPRAGESGGPPTPPTATGAPPATAASPTDEPTEAPTIAPTAAPTTPPPSPTAARSTDEPLGHRLSFGRIWLPALRNLR